MKMDELIESHEAISQVIEIMRPASFDKRMTDEEGKAYYSVIKAKQIISHEIAENLPY